MSEKLAGTAIVGAAASNVCFLLFCLESCLSGNDNIADVSHFRLSLEHAVVAIPKILIRFWWMRSRIGGGYLNVCRGKSTHMGASDCFISAII